MADEERVIDASQAGVAGAFGLFLIYVEGNSAKGGAAVALHVHGNEKFGLLVGR